MLRLSTYLRAQAAAPLSLALWLGCYAPSPAEGLPCSESERCPEGQTCGEDGVCRVEPATRDAGIDAPGEPDAGDPLAEEPSRISITDGRSDAPSLVWTGSEYGLAWVDDRGGNDEIYFARIDRGGEPIGEPLRVTDAAGDARDPSLVWTGSDYAVAWADDAEDNDYEIYFARIAEAGTPIGDPVRITEADGFSGSPSLVWNGTGFGLAWNDGRGQTYEIYFARLTLGGGLIGELVPVTADDGSFSSSPSLIWTGNGYAIAWDDLRDGNGEIYFTRVSADGEKAGGDIRVTTEGSFSGQPALAWADSFWGVAWADLRAENREIFFARLAATGVNDSGSRKVTADPGSAYRPDMLRVEDSFALVWQEDPFDSNDVYFARLDRDGAILGDVLSVAEGPDHAREPSFVWTGSAYAFAWADNRHGNYEIFFRELSP